MLYPVVGPVTVSMDPAAPLRVSQSPPKPVVQAVARGRAPPGPGRGRWWKFESVVEGPIWAEVLSGPPDRLATTPVLPKNWVELPVPSDR